MMLKSNFQISKFLLVLFISNLLSSFSRKIEKSTFFSSNFNEKFKNKLMHLDANAFAMNVVDPVYYSNTKVQQKHL